MALSTPTGFINPTFNPEEIRQLAEQISEVMHEGGELSVLESKVDPRLLEKVSRCLNRMEDRPEQIREVEAVLMNSNEPTLGVAILQQAFLIRSDHALVKIVDQLNRLAQSTDTKTAKLSLVALKEAANSEIPRLQNLGCRALFASAKLSPEELLRFAQSQNLNFLYRIQSVQALLFRQSELGPEALLLLVDYWDKMSDGQKNSFQTEMFELAKRMDQYETLDRSVVEPIIEKLFTALDTPGPRKDYWNVVQTALAALPQYAIEYFQKLPLQLRLTASVVFTLGKCARRTSQATIALMDLAEESIKDNYNLWILNKIAQKLERARHEGLLPRLEALIGLAFEYVMDDENEQFLNYLEAAKKYWITGQDNQNLAGYLNARAAEYEEYPQLEENEALQIRWQFENQHNQLHLWSVKPSERTVLFEAMKMTSESKPWSKSVSYLLANYDSLTETERLAVLDVCGYVAQGEAKSLTQSQKLREMRGFFEKVARNGTYAESQKARQWLEKLTGEVLPE